MPDVRLHFRDDDERLSAAPWDHQQNVARFVAVTDSRDAPIPADVRISRVSQALVFQRSHVANWWHSMGEDGADMYARACRYQDGSGLLPLDIYMCAQAISSSTAAIPRDTCVPRNAEDTVPHM